MGAGVTRLDAATGGVHVPAGLVRPGCEWVVPLLAANGMPIEMADVAWRESRCDPGARNENRRTRDDSWGVLQLNWWPGSSRKELQLTCGVSDPSVLLDGKRNIECAGRLWAKYGSGPWNPEWYGE